MENSPTVFPDTVELANSDTSAETVTHSEKYHPSEEMSAGSEVVTSDSVSHTNKETSSVVQVCNGGPQDEAPSGQILPFEPDDNPFDSSSELEEEEQETIVSVSHTKEEISQTVPVGYKSPQDKSSMKPSLTFEPDVILIDSSSEIEDEEKVTIRRVSQTNEEISPAMHLGKKCLQDQASLKPILTIEPDDNPINPSSKLGNKDDITSGNSDCDSTTYSPCYMDVQLVDSQVEEVFVTPMMPEGSSGSEILSHLEKNSMEATTQDPIDQGENITIENEKRGREQIEAPSSPLSLLEIVERDHDYGLYMDKNAPLPSETPCSLCDMSFTSTRNLCQHVKAAHENDEHGGKMIVCNLCGLSLSSAMSLASHLEQEHIIEDKVLCKMCGKRMKHDHLELHIKRMHTGNFDNSYLCHLCPKIFAAPASLRSHLSYAHVDKKDFICDQCPASFKNMQKLKGHIKGVHEGRQFVCGVCGKVCSNKSNLQRHFKLIHNTGPTKPFECKICGKRFTQKCTLATHTETVHYGRYRYTCEICNAGFTSSTHLKKHQVRYKQDPDHPRRPKRGPGKKQGEPGERIKLKKREYKCSICDKVIRSTTKANLLRHMKLIHNPDGVKPYECEQCGARFTQKCGLRAHTKTVHLRKFRYNCEICNAGYEARPHLERHKKNHGHCQ